MTALCSTTKVDLIRSLGADHVIDYTLSERADRPRHVRVVREFGRNMVGGFRRILQGRPVAPFVRQSLRTFTVVPNRDDLKTLRGLLGTVGSRR